MAPEPACLRSRRVLEGKRTGRDLQAQDHTAIQYGKMNPTLAGKIEAKMAVDAGHAAFNRNTTDA